MGKLDGKVALITGGTSGIGESIVNLFCVEGAEVVFLGRNIERGINIQSSNIKKGYKCLFIQCDISVEDEIKKCKEKFCERYSKLDILVNCAGIWMTYLLNEITFSDYELMFRTNVASVIFITKSFIDYLVNARGNIINVSSIGGMQSHIAGRSQYLYAATKAAVIQFSQLCALNYADSIRVNCLCPGPNDTPIYLNKDFSWVKDQIPMGRIGKPEEVAKAALFLVSDDASYINGCVLTVDGGASIK